MDDFRENSGYVEVEHTADWALRVWAPDFEKLLVQAAIGMNALSGGLTRERSVQRSIQLKFTDPEELLVSFLSEILYFNVQENLAFPEIKITIRDHNLTAVLNGGVVHGWVKEIKAVTYHHLAIQHTASGLETTIVFDV